MTDKCYRCGSTQSLRRTCDNTEPYPRIVTECSKCDAKDILEYWLDWYIRCQDMNKREAKDLVKTMTRLAGAMGLLAWTRKLRYMLPEGMRHVWGKPWGKEPVSLWKRLK